MTVLLPPECRLLIVDDEEHITAALRDYFTILGYVVDTAGSESAAHVLLDDFNYAAVVTDLRLSDSRRMEGLEIIRHVRVRHPQAACIVLTAFGDPENKAEAQRRGANALVQKPAPLHVLAELLAGVLNHGHQNS